MIPRSRLVALIAVLALAVALVGCSPSGKTITVHHGAPTATVDLVSAGTASPGDVRVFSAATTDDAGAALGHLRATLTTTEIAANGDETRSAFMVFSFAKPEDQIVVGGESAYPKDAATIPAGTATTRPIIGGSGAYVGARGYAESIHNADGSWKHVLHLQP